MARIALVDPATAPPATQAAYDEIRSLWGGQVFTDWQPLGHSPQILASLARLFYNLQGEQGGSITDVRDKELVAIRTSHMNGCEYCLGHNVDLGQVVGLSMEVILAAIAPDYAASPLLTDSQKAIIAWTSAITRNTAAADDAALAALREHFSDAEIAELTLMSCLFNGWNRFTHAFHIELEAGPDRDGIVACLARATPVEVPVRE